jgi:hypothetical protein
MGQLWFASRARGVHGYFGSALGSITVVLRAGVASARGQAGPRTLLANAGAHGLHVNARDYRQHRAADDPFAFVTLATVRRGGVSLLGFAGANPGANQRGGRRKSFAAFTYDAELVASQAGCRGSESRLPLFVKPVDSSCQRAFRFDGAGTYGDGPGFPDFPGFACCLVHDCLQCTRFAGSWYSRRARCHAQKSCHTTPKSPNTNFRRLKCCLIHDGAP